MRKILLTVSLVAHSLGIFAQSGDSGKQIIFQFVPGEGMFYIPWRGNEAELQRLYALIDTFHGEIASGKTPIYVDGYSASMREHSRNVQLAFTRANRVKSEIITHKGLHERHFITKNHTTGYTAADGTIHKDAVTITLTIPIKAPTTPPQPSQHAEPQPEPDTRPGMTPTPVTEDTRYPASQHEPDQPAKPYAFALRTNLLYNTTLTPTLGIEWRINRDFSVKIDGSYAFWGDEHGKVQKLWLISPELRYYMGGTQRFYLGLGGNYGEYNIYKGLIGSTFPDKTGYQGNLWNAGITTGYRLYLSRHFSLDFNLGLGYNRLEYDSFTLSNDIRIFRKKEQKKTYWSPTQAGISLLWTIK